MELQSLTRRDLIFPNLPGSNSEDFLFAFSEHLASHGLVDSADGVCSKLLERELLGSTGIGSGVAIPHCKLSGLDRVVLAVATSREGVKFGAVDDNAVRLFFLVLSPEKDPAAHLKSLASISKWVKADHHVERILELDNADAIHEMLREDYETS